MSSKHKMGVLVWLIIFASFMSFSAAKVPPPIALPNCTDTCGNVSIPYPFGIGDSRCFLNPFYEITCNKSVSRPFLRKFNLEVLDIGIDMSGFLIVNNPVYSTCRDGSSWNSTDFGGSPFSFSTGLNKLYGAGCGNTRMKGRNDTLLAACTSVCGPSNSSSRLCYGVNCCQATIHSTAIDFYRLTSTVNSSACTFASLASDETGLLAIQHEYFSTNISSNPLMIKNRVYTRVLLSWRILTKGDYIERDAAHSCSSDRDNYLLWSCRCQERYEGNPYMPNGCQVVEACKNCKGSCDYYYTDHESGTPHYRCIQSKTKEIIIGAGTMGGGALMMILLIFCLWLIKIIKKKRKLRLERKFYKRNGGLLLQQKLSTNEVSWDTIKIFRVRELERATDNFNIDRILGRGGQGTVYKGMLTDGNIVAVKKSKLACDGQVEQFINEVVILSQINHRNIVKLLGCCLETEVPLLVYEFISNGTLTQLIRNQEEFPLSWEMRLRIATEVSGALAYLHSATSEPIFHRDIKSDNILLDEKYRAKVADFGTSKSIDADKSHLTTVVQGTFGYLDPEFFRSSQFTDKSDVYSFGVVLAELLTGERPIMLRAESEEKSLVALFISSLDEDSLFEIIDKRVAREGDKDEITTLAILASRCLNMNGKQRPAMKEVMLEIEKIRKRHLHSNASENIRPGQSITESNTELEGNLSSTSFSDYTESFSSNADLLLMNEESKNY